jgi:pilus assembly protein CpaF
MLALAGLNVPPRVARTQIASAIGMVIQVNRLIDGRRKVTSITEVTGMEGDVITMQEIFSFRQTGVDEQGNVNGHFQASGVRPRLYERIKACGITLPESIFDPGIRWE